jgi:hypothetical protein
MPNGITGDFDVVAEFAVPAVNRLLAAMHCVERFPHSIAVRVDDIPVPPDRPFRPPVLVEAVDIIGDTVSDNDTIGHPIPVTAEMFEGNSWHPGLDSIVNLHGGVLDTAFEPSQLQGRAQLQISPPTIHFPDSSGTNITVKMGIMARYLPDPGTPPVAEFVRGELTITASVLQAASQAGDVIEVDIRSANTVVNFNAQWSSTPIGVQDLAGINLLIRNAIRSAFLPSNSSLPEGVEHIQFKTVGGTNGAVAVMLNMAGAAGNRGSVTQPFLTANDHFGFAASADYVKRAFQPTLDGILTEPIDPVKFKIDSVVHTWNVTYVITLNDASVALESGKIVLTVRGHAHTGTSWLPDFNFTARFDFTLEPDGATVNLEPGDISLDTSSWIIDRFRGPAEKSLRRLLNATLSSTGANSKVREMLSAEGNLGEFLDSLLKPVRKDPIVEPRLFSLRYTAADISPDAVVLRGALSVAPWPAPHVEFEMIPGSSSSGPLGSSAIFDGPDYSALKAWIPGGTIDGFEWKRYHQTQPGAVDHNKFVKLYEGPTIASDATPSNVVGGWAPLCVTVHGTRLTRRGPVVPETVIATACAFHTFPGLDAAADGGNLTVALASPTSDGNVGVHGTATIKPSAATTFAANLLIHVSGTGVADPALLVEAVRKSERPDAPVALILAADSDTLARTRFVEGVSYADNSDGSWSRQVRAPGRTPVTVLSDSSGNIIWRHDGEISADALARSIRPHLRAGARQPRSVGTTNVKPGRRPPNFIFEHSPGRELTLRKLAGRAVTLVFSDGSETPPHRADDEGVTLVIEQSVKQAGKRQSSGAGAAIRVDDSSGSIAAAYGVTMRPTVMTIDSLGALRSIHYGTSPIGETRPERSAE